MVFIVVIISNIIPDIACIIFYAVIEVLVLIAEKMEFRVCSSQRIVPPRFPFKAPCYWGKGRDT